MNKRFILLLTGLFISSNALAADEVQPIIYNRVIMRLIPKPEAKIIPSPSSLPDPKPVAASKEDEKRPLPGNQLTTKADEKKKEELKVDKIAIEPQPESPPAPPPRVPIDFTIEIKSPDFLHQSDFISQTSFAEHEGLFISIDPPDKAFVKSTNMLSQSDVLFLNEDGVVTKIAPNLNLSDLNEPIPSGGIVRGFLYLKPGSVEQDRITPGDRFENGIFKTHPVILQ